jgi:hypothetical protein
MQSQNGDEKGERHAEQASSSRRVACECGREEESLSGEAGDGHTPEEGVEGGSARSGRKDQQQSFENDTETRLRSATAL